MALTLVPCGDGGRWAAARGGPASPPSPRGQQACAGVRARSREARSGSGAAVVVLLRGCQAMASANAEAAGPNANQGCRSSPGALRRAPPRRPKPLGAPTLGLKGKQGEEGPGFETGRDPLSPKHPPKREL